jgi:hypothetical protein
MTPQLYASVALAQLVRAQQRYSTCEPELGSISAKLITWGYVESSNSRILGVSWRSRAEDPGGDRQPLILFHIAR